jgi:hypothetical protein
MIKYAKVSASDASITDKTEASNPVIKQHVKFKAGYLLVANTMKANSDHIIKPAKISVGKLLVVGELGCSFLLANIHVLKIDPNIELPMLSIGESTN